MKHHFLALVLVTAGALWPAEMLAKPVPFNATVLRVLDGDTYLVQPVGSKLEKKVRLEKGDCPELSHNSKEIDQPGGRDALAYATKQINGKGVKVSPSGMSYGRIVASVTEPDGTDLAFDLVSHGWAQCDPRYHPPKELKDAEAAAKKAKLGIWVGTPVPPWTWRAEGRAKLQQQKQSPKPRLFLRRRAA